jgi:predicted aminopeptidase
VKPVFGLRLARIIVVASLCTAVSGCYYMQAARGQFEVMRKRQPIAKVVVASDTPAELAERLGLVEEARTFAVGELGLPDNDSYRSYADLGRDYVVWNVIAAPEFSLQPKRWCYPIVGCVSYRGYFSAESAQRKAAQLGKDGYDVAFGGVAAYSTLGRFSDPILNTMMRWEDIDLIAVMFHELAHQVLYIKDDSAFNESFATAVEEFGIERWLGSRQQPDDLADYRQRRDLRGALMRAIEVARLDLEQIYSAATATGAKRAQKQQRLLRLAAEVNALFEAAGREPPAWIGNDLNNARLVSMALYHGRLPAFRALLMRCANELQCFYREAEALGELGEAERNEQLDNLQAIDLASSAQRPTRGAF